MAFIQTQWREDYGFTSQEFFDVGSLSIDQIEKQLETRYAEVWDLEKNKHDCSSICESGLFSWNFINISKLGG